MADADKVVQVKKETKRFITYQKQIDRFNIKRSRVELTPAVCEVCGFDIGAHNGLGPYAEMEADTKSAVRSAVEKHKKEFHNKADNLIVEEDQLPKQFLSTKSMRTK
jgi:hypothetical protein